MSPPGTLTALRQDPDWLHKQREERSGEGRPGAHAMYRAVCDLPEVRSLGLSPAKLSRLVRSYIASATYERDLVSWLISYADPTGETAVANVMRERR